MLKDCLEIFKEFKGDDDSVILDSYILADGDYIIVRKDGSLDHSFIKFDKKSKTVENKPTNYDELCFLDYNSKLLDMNKPVDTKKVIHSNNYLSFFIKQENLHSGKLTEKIINNYYEILSNPEIKYTKASEKIMYEKVREKLGDVDQSELEKSKSWILENILNINEENIIEDRANDQKITLSGGKVYLKIFFEADQEKYIRENQRYLLMKLYNNNNYSVEVDGNILGLPNDNMGLNSKKIFLEHKNQKNTVPYLIESEEALLQKSFFDYLMNQVSAGKNIIYLDNNDNAVDEKLIVASKSGEAPENGFSGYILNVKKGTEARIFYQDIINEYNNKLKKEFHYKNHTGNIGLDEVFGKVNEKKIIQSELNEIMFFKFLINNYFEDEGDIKLAGDFDKSNFKNYIILSRNSIFQWLYNDDERGMKRVVNTIFPKIVKYSIDNGYIKKAIYQFNMYLSFKEYFKGDEDMSTDYISIEKELDQKINNKAEKIIKSDEEYYFAIGQLVNFYISLNKSKDKKHSLANPFLNAKNDSMIKDRLLRFFKKYNYDLSTSGTRFNNLYGMIAVYEAKGKVNQDAIIAGYLRDNIIYKKKSIEDNADLNEEKNLEEVK